MRTLEEHSARLVSRPSSDSARPYRTPPAPSTHGGQPEPFDVPRPRQSFPETPVNSPLPAPLIPGNSSGSASGPALEWVFCGHCGEKIGSSDVYCAHCGSRQPLAGGPSNYIGQGSASRVTAQLVVIGTSEMVKPFAIDKDNVLIGRTDPHTSIFPEIDLTMYDPETKVSRRHAKIYRQGDQFLIEDLGSVNGTIINSISGGSIRLNAKSPRVLSAGDELKLGGTILKFMIM